MTPSVGKFTPKPPSKIARSDSPSPYFSLPPHSKALLSSFLRRAVRHTPFRRGLAWGGVFGLTAMGSAAVGVAIALITPSSWSSIPGLNALLPAGANSPENPPAEGLLPYRLARPVNILVMGVDRVLDAPMGSPEALNGRSDTMLLLRFNPEDHSVRMLSIPRDTRVNLPSLGYGKINDANVRGGSKLATQVVSATLHQVPIDRYLRVTTAAFKRIIDLVGGVEVYVAQPMVYRDDTQKLNINLAAGWQTLNGEQAEQFARFRKDQYGDIGRVQRQQILLKALQQRIASPGLLPRIPEALKIMREEVDTNLSLEEWLALANFGLGLRRDDLKMVMLPGRFSHPDEFDARSYWILSETGRDRVMAAYFDQSLTQPIVSPRSLHHLRIAVQNATDNPDASQNLVYTLQKAGFKNVFATQDASQLIGQTEIVVQRGDLQAAQSLQASLGIGKVEADSTGDLDSDLTLRIGLDSQKINLEGSLQKTAASAP